MLKYFRHPLTISLTLAFALFYFLIPHLADAIVSHPVYSKYAGKEANKIVRTLQMYWVYPFGKWLGTNWRAVAVLPYWLLIFAFLRFTYVRYKKAWKYGSIAIISLLVLLYCFPNLLLLFENNRPSISHGKVSNGHIENAKRVPMRGANYTTYTFWGYLLGRTYAHERVKHTILDAYTACQKSCPETRFVLGEIGSRHGGPFLPHRTHRNGLSVDFMTPFQKNGKAYTGNTLGKLWGYGWELDQKGETAKVRIDYEIMARHLLALEASAKANGLRIQKVIFDPVLRPFLLASPSGKKIRHLPFTKNRVIVRHDDHYHIDFEVL